jgi:hypothetical protein
MVAPVANSQYRELVYGVTKLLETKVHEDKINTGPLAF